MNDQISSEKFKGVIQLFKESFSLYRVRTKVLFGITIIAVGVNFLGGVLLNYLFNTNIKYSLFFSFIWAIILLSSLFIWLLAIPSLIFAIKENIGVKEAYRKGLKIFPSFFWIYFLFNAIFVGGFLLFLIPAILFFVWFSLAIFVLVFEEKKGMDALFKSQHLISWKFWGVLKRYIGFGLFLLLILILVLSPLFIFKVSEAKIEKISKAIGYLLQIFLTPLILIYGFLIYENLERIKKEIPYQEPSKKRKLKYILPIALGSLIFLLVFSFNFMNIFFGRDEPPPDDRDLWLSRIEIPKEENALYYLIPHFYLSQYEKEEVYKYWPDLKESKKIYWPAEKEDLIKNIISQKEWDEKFVKELLEENKEVLDSFEKAVKSSYFQDPMTQDPKTVHAGILIIPTRGLTKIANLNLIEGIYLFKQGKEEMAFNEVIKTIKFGQMIEDAPRPTLIEYLVGMRIKESALESLRGMISSSSLPSEKLKEYIIELNEFKLNERGLKNVFKMEYIFNANTKAKIDAAIAGKSSKEELKELGLEETPFLKRRMGRFNFYYKPNKTLRMFADITKDLINNVDKNCKEIKLPEIKSLVPSSKIKMLFTENLIGKMFYDIIIVSHANTFTHKCEEDFSVIGTQVLLAIKAFKMEKGNLPKTLDDLIPEYLPEAPIDPFDGEYVRYLSDKRIIYSVGKDLKDNLGKEGDIVFEIKF
jgi:MFS family permease